MCAVSACHGYLISHNLLNNLSIGLFDGRAQYADKTQSRDFITLAPLLRTHYTSRAVFNIITEYVDTP